MRVCYEEEVLDELACHWESDEPHALGLQARGAEIIAYLDDKEVLRCRESERICGGFGYLVETGNLGFQNGKAD